MCKNDQFRYHCISPQNYYSDHSIMVYTSNKNRKLFCCHFGLILSKNNASIWHSKGCLMKKSIYKISRQSLRKKYLVVSILGKKLLTYMSIFYFSQENVANRFWSMLRIALAWKACTIGDDFDVYLWWKITYLSFYKL